jgi:hypothetical protein
VAQSSPVASQRSQVYVTVIGSSPVHDVGTRISVLPFRASPVRSGLPLALGLKRGAGSVGNVWFVKFVSAPAAFVPVM